MKRLPLSVFVVGLFAALIPTTALAKGPVEATLEGPGLTSPIRFGGSGGDVEEPWVSLMELAEVAGFFPAAFGASRPDPMLDERPTGDLGPRYTLTCDLGSGSAGDHDVVVQDVYPYAQPSPMTFMAAGQRFYGTRETRGGWWVDWSPGASPLKDLLVAAGLPAERPTVKGTGDRFAWFAAGSLAALGAVLGVSALLAFRSKRRPRAAAA